MNDVCANFVFLTTVCSVLCSPADVLHFISGIVRVIQEKPNNEGILDIDKSDLNQLLYVFSKQLMDTADYVSATDGQKVAEW